MKILIIGSSGNIGSFIRDRLLEKGYMITGISKSKSKLVNKNYKHHQININSKNADKKISKLLKNNHTCIYSINKKEKPKDFVYDIKLLINYHVFFLYKILKPQSKKKKVIVINSDVVTKKVSNFHYTITKQIKHTMALFSSDLFSKNIDMYSILLGKVSADKHELKIKLINNIMKILKKNFNKKVFKNY